MPFAIDLAKREIAALARVPSLIVIDQKTNKQLQLSIEVGKEQDCGDGITATVLQVYQRLRISLDGDQPKPFEDSPGTTLNPGLHVLIKHPDGTEENPDGTEEKRLAFTSPMGHTGQNDSLALLYQVGEGGMIKDYFSDLEVIENGNVVATKTIQVNDPLHWKGYHFYQSSYDVRAGMYTVLSVTSDKGLYIVYAGYWLMCLGVILQCWISPALKSRKSSQESSPIQEGGSDAL